MVKKVVDVDVGAVQEVVDGATLLNTAVPSCGVARNPCGIRKRKDRKTITIRDMAHPLQESYPKNARRSSSF